MHAVGPPFKIVVADFNSAEYIAVKNRSHNTFKLSPDAYKSFVFDQNGHRRRPSADTLYET